MHPIHVSHTARRNRLILPIAVIALGIALFSIANVVQATDAAKLAASTALSPHAAYPTTTTLTSSQNPSTFGQAVTFTAVVSSGVQIVSGVVTFTIDSIVVDTRALVPGAPAAATYVTSSLAVSSHTVRVDYYDATGTFDPGSANLSPNQTVNIASTTTTVVSSASPSVFGQTVWFTATVSAAPPGSGTPTGSVQFKDGAVNLGGPVALTTGSASISTAGLSAGTHVITVDYPGDGNFNASTGTLSPNQVVGKANTTTTLASSANPSV
ncbi:MAG TPA: Ig-like domain-containing protein, partial [Anaerolineae bacterium]